MAFPAKTERNRKLIADYLGGLSRAEVEEKYNLARGTVNRILTKNKVRLPKEERYARQHFEGRNYSNVGRPKVWPDCPDHIKPEYMKLRDHYGFKAAEARKILESENA